MRQARDLFEKGAKLGHDMKILDIGGGFPGEDSKEITIEQVHYLVSKSSHIINSSFIISIDC